MKLNKKLILLVSILLVVSLTLIACNKPAQSDKVNSTDTSGLGNYPNKPINLIVTWGAGGGTDVTARAFVKEAEKHIGQTFLVNNVTGGGGSVGWQQVKASPADGYTLTVLTIDILNHSVKADQTKLSYEDFIPVANMSKYPSIIAVPADSKYETFKDLLEDAKANPGKVRIGNGGLGKDNHQIALSVEDATGAKFNHVPFDGGAPAIAAALGGNIEGLISNPPEAGGRPDMKILVQFGPERSPDLPNVPTALELGYNIVGESFRMIGVPKDTPKEIINFLEEKFKLASEEEAWKEFAEKSKASPFYLDVAESQKLLDDIFKVKKDIVEKFGL